MASCTSVEVDRRVAQGRSRGSDRGDAVEGDPGPSLGTILSVGIGFGLVLIALVVYSISKPYRFYDHFEWQAAAFLEGETAIRYPVEAQGSSPGNAFFQDVMEVPSDDGVPRAVIPFPPLPAVVLVPFVAAFGHDTDGQLLFAAIGAIDVGIAWWLLGRLPVRRRVRVLGTIFFGFGTVFWYAAQLGTTWYQAHVLAVGLAMLSIGIALGGDRDSALDEDELPGEPGPGLAASPPSSGGALAATAAFVRAGIDGRQFLAGLLFGLACTARLTVVFAAPFFLLVGTGGSWQRRGLSAALGAAIPLAALVAYNVAATGDPFNPAYDHLYRLEASFYTPLNYNLDWGIEDPRYLPQNLQIMLLNTPVLEPDVVPAALGAGEALCTDPGAVRGLFDPDCPLALPRDTGMSLILTSPAYLLAWPALRRLWGRSRLVTGAALATGLIALVNVMHFSQGWVQFGYRFSNDFVPWALLVVALGMERLRSGLGFALAVALVVVSVAVNLWGVVWGNVLGW
jgi:hypothetical protein